MKRKLIAALLALMMLPVLSAPAAALEPRDFSGGALSGLAADGDALLVTDTYNKVIWRVEDGTVTRAAGQRGVEDLWGEPTGSYVDGAMLEARFMEPWAIAPYLDGYAVTDTAANVVRYLDGKNVRTAAGSGKAGSSNGAGSQVSFSRPTGLAAGPDGELYIADTDNGLIRRMDRNGAVITWASGLVEPTGLCWADGALNVAETGRSRICRIVGGKVTDVIGGGAPDEDGVYPGGYVDGPVEKAQFEHPQGIAVTEDGTIYVSDTGNGAVRKIADGRVTTLLSYAHHDNAVVEPRGLLVQGGTLLAADAFLQTILEIPSAPADYRDVPADSWYYTAAMEAAARGVAQGVTADTFAPDAPTTRAMFVTMLSKVHCITDGSAVINGSHVFADIPADSWYGPAARWAADGGVAYGSGDRFLGDRPISREELVTMLYSYAASCGLDVSQRADLTVFRDRAQVSGYAVDAMRWAVANGILSGMTQDTLAPQGTATRAQTVQLLTGFMNWAGI